MKRKLAVSTRSSSVSTTGLLPVWDGTIPRLRIRIRLLASYAKDLDIVVFNGHVHTTEIYDVDGVKYLLLGGGGAEQDPILPGRTSVKMPPDYPPISIRRPLLRARSTATLQSMSNQARTRNSRSIVSGRGRPSRLKAWSWGVFSNEGSQLRAFPVVLPPENIPRGAFALRPSSASGCKLLSDLNANLSLRT